MIVTLIDLLQKSLNNPDLHRNLKLSILFLNFFITITTTWFKVILNEKEGIFPL